jgi:RNase P subunit RPR2
MAKLEKQGLKSSHQDKILREINELFKNNPSKEEIKEARKKAMRVNLKLPLEIRRKFCHHCNSLLRGRIRLKNGKKIIQCSECGKYTRIPYK